MSDATNMPTIRFIGARLIESGTASFARRLDRYRRQRRKQLFTGKVITALAELGLAEPEFDRPVKLLLRQVCASCHAQDQEDANAYALAIKFFLRFTLEYPHLVDKAVMFKSVLIHSMSVIRSWHLVNRIDRTLAESTIEQIKQFLVMQLRGVDATDEDRLLAELQIREL